VHTADLKLLKHNIYCLRKYIGDTKVFILSRTENLTNIYPKILFSSHINIHRIIIDRHNIIRITF